MTTDERLLHPANVEGSSLTTGESVHAELQATGWRYYAVDSVAYERRILLAGGPFLMALTAIVSAVGNHRRRAAAERVAAAQWRPLGPLRIVVTSDRLLVWHQGAWWSVWLAAVTNVCFERAHESLDLYFEGDVPYRLVGPQVPALALLLDAVVSESDADLGNAIRSTA